MPKYMLCLLIFLYTYLNAGNPTLVKAAKQLQFSQQWKIERVKVSDRWEFERQQIKTNKLQNEDLLLTYDGASEYPAKSGYHVGESKVFARILVSGECGLPLPGGYDYARHPVSQVEAGDILQKNTPQPHTMIVLAVNSGQVKVLHSNWSAFHRISHNTFTLSWLVENGFKVFKPGQDNVENTIEPQRKQFTTKSADVKARALGSWRIVVTGEIPYYRVSQGTIISHSGPGGQIRVNETWTVSNTIQCEVGVALKIVSAKVGFDVTSSFSRSLQYWREVSPGKYGSVDLYYKYMVKNFDVYYKPFLGSERFEGSGSAYKWQAAEYQYRESNN